MIPIMFQKCRTHFESRNRKSSAPALFCISKHQNPFSSSDFDGIIDDTRFVNYERHAFAGGLMFSEVIPGSDTIRVYNAGSVQMDLTGIEVWNGGSKCASITGTLDAGTESGTISCNVDADDGIYLVDADGDNGNLGGSDTDESADEEDKAWVIDGVCWNDGSGTESECQSGRMIDAGVWGAGDYVDESAGSGGIQLSSNGNNDDAIDDWEAIPEFSTLIMPIASVLMIVGYNYHRRKNLPEA